MQPQISLLAIIALIGGCAGTRAPFLQRDAAPDTLTVSESSIHPESGSGCGATTCTGCCTAIGACVSGQIDDECGKGGVLCVVCSAKKQTCSVGTCAGCTPVCAGKTCGDADSCGSSCSAGSGCCAPTCGGKTCGEANGCGGTCQAGSGCCSPSCAGKTCSSPDGCGGFCQAGSGCCTPSCSGKKCGEGNGCSGTCQPGSGCCTPACAGKKCGESDGCSGGCAVGSGCTPSCGALLGSKGLPDAGGGCCGYGCDTTQAGGPGTTHDCAYCCSSTAGQSACTVPSCGALLWFKKLPDAGTGCCSSGCKTTQGGGPGATTDCTYCCSSTPGASVCL